MSYILKLKSNPNNSTYISVFNQQFSAKFTSKPKASKPSFGIRKQQLFSSVSIELEHVIIHSISVTTPWKYNIPVVLFDIPINSDKSSTTPEYFLTKFHETKSNYPQHIDIYTDGSKIGYKIAFAVVSKVIPNK